VTLTPDIAFRCHMHWDRPWLNRRIEAAYHQMMFEYTMLETIAALASETAADAVQGILQGFSHEASWLAWYGRTE